MEQFYNLIRQWYVPTKYVKMMPGQAEQTLIYRARQVGIRYEPRVLGSSYIHTWKGSWSMEDEISMMI